MYKANGIASYEEGELTIRIKKSETPQSWYHERIGEEFDVDTFFEDDGRYVVWDENGNWRFVNAGDAEIAKDNSVLKTIEEVGELSE